MKKLAKDAKASELSAALDGVTVLQKGAEDVVAYAKEEATVDVEGGLKRCGGQGDILSGTVGTALAWGKCYEDGAFGCVSGPPYRDPTLY